MRSKSDSIWSQKLFFPLQNIQNCSKGTFSFATVPEKTCFDKNDPIRYSVSGSLIGIIKLEMGCMQSQSYGMENKIVL